MWALSLLQMASVHDTMIQLPGVSAKTSEQHDEIGKSRTIQDYKDCQRFYEWLTDRNPFHNADENLYSLSTYLTRQQSKERTRSQTWNPCRTQRQQKAKKRWQNQVSCSIG